MSVQPNPVSQTATVVFDPARTALRQLRDWVRDCGFHCAGQLVPEHICDPMAEPDLSVAVDTAPARPRAAPPEHAPPEHVAAAHDDHDGMSMAAMAADMRNRFLVSLVFSLLVMLWSPMASDMFGLHVATPWGLRQDIWALLLSLPVMGYSATIFFAGAVRALRARTLDMMVLVAVGIGAGWLYSLAITLDRWRRGVLRGVDDAGDIRAAGPLVRDARPGRRQRRDPHAASLTPSPVLATT